MKTAFIRRLALFALVVGVGALATSCATTSGIHSGVLIEKGSAKGGGSQLIKRHD